MSTPLDLLGGPEPVRRPRASGRLQVLATGVAAVTVLVAGVASAGYLQLRPSGASPEEVMPAGTVAFAKLDLDPSASQKLAVYEISKRFPASGVTGVESLKDDLLTAAFQSVGADYAKDDKGWIGDRVGIGALPGKDAPHPVIAVQVKDREVAAARLDKVDEQDFFYAFARDDYVLLSDDQQVVDDAVAADEHLSDEKAYTDAVDALNGDTLLSAWVDVARVVDVLPADLLDQLPLSAKDLDGAGQVVLGLRAESKALELEALATGRETRSQAPGTDLVQQFPADVLVAVGATGVGEGLAAAYTAQRAALEQLDSMGVLDAARSAGISLPADLRTLLGEEIAAYVSGTEADPRVAVRVRTGNTGRAKAVLRKVVDAIGEATGDPAPAGFLDSAYADTSGGYVVGFPESELKRASAGGLGSSAAFQAAVPDAQGAQLVVYVDVQRLVRAVGLDDVPDAVRELQAVGITAHGARIRLRVTFT